MVDRKRTDDDVSNSAVGTTESSEQSAKPRRVWLAVVLSLLFGPVGQIYAGGLRRSLVLWAMACSAVPAVAIMLAWLPVGQMGSIAFLFSAVAVPLYLPVDAFYLARRNRLTPLKRYQRWWVYLVAIPAFTTGNYLVSFVVRALVVEAFVIPTRSMSPTLLAGDRLLVDKLYAPQDVQRNDLVVFRSGNSESTVHVKRLVGMPNDEIEIRDEQVFLNGEKWDDPHAVIDDTIPVHPDLVEYGPRKIPSDSCFVMGDNRRMSLDSRMTGFIPLTDICGKGRLIYWSNERSFPHPHDTTHFKTGRFRWERVGQRLD